mgnify:CR=1 FL=1
MDALWEMKKLEKTYKELTGRDIKEDLEKTNVKNGVTND